MRQGDTVYVLRDIPIDDKHPDVSGKTGEKGDSSKTKRLDRKKVKNVGKGKTEEVASNKVCLLLFLHWYVGKALVMKNNL